MTDKASEITKEFGSAVRRAREALGLKQAELAKAAGTSPTTLSSIENGKSATNLAEIARISAALGKAPWELLRPEAPTLIRAAEPADQPDRRDPVASAHATRPSTLVGDIVFMLTALKDDELRRIRDTVSVALRARGITLAELEKIRRHGK